MSKSKGLTFFLSFVPGAGHYYLGLMQRGLHFNLLFFGVIGLMSLTGLEPLPLLLPVIWFYALFDALQAASAMAAGAEVPDRPLLKAEYFRLKPATLGWILICCGVYSLLRFGLDNHLLPLPSHLLRDLNRVVASFVLIGFGIYSLVRRKPGGEGAAAE